MTLARTEQAYAGLRKSISVSAVTHPSKAAVVDERTTLTYCELERRVTETEVKLRELGAAGSTICLLLPAGIDYVTAVVAVIGVRGVFAPLDTEWPQSRASAAIRLARPAIVIATKSLQERAQSLVTDLETQPVIITLDAGVLRRSEPLYESSRPRSAASVHRVNTGDDWQDDSLYLVYTSGSTGEPNAVEGRHGSLAHFIKWQADAYQVTEACRVAQLAPTTFDVHLRDVFLPLTVGGTIVVPDLATRRNPVRLVSWLQDYGVNLIHIVPSLFKVLAESVAQRRENSVIGAPLETVFFSGERLYTRDVDGFRRVLPAGTRLVNFYGPSECTLIKTHFRIPAAGGGSFPEVVPLGWPIEECEVVIGEAERTCAPGEVGEIRLRSTHLAKGYLGNSALTAKNFVAVEDAGGRRTREYRTGDLGLVDPAGCLHFIGRRDHQVKINGNRVELGEVERRVRDVLGIKDAVVVMASQAGQPPVLACIYAAEKEILPHEIRKGLAAALPGYMIPARFVARRELPLSPNGKVDRAACARALANPTGVSFEESFHG